MRTQHWVERLASRVNADVAGAAALAVAQAQQTRDAVYVMPTDEHAAASDIIGPARQIVTADVAVVLAITHRRRGAGGLDEVETLRDEVRYALLGWSPPGAASPVGYRGGRLLQVADATIWWQYVFRVDYLISEVTE